MNAIDLLKQDHKKVKALLENLERTTDRSAAKRADLLERISLELAVHTAIEEEIFYPAFREAGERKEDEKLFFEALEEHRAVKKLVLPDLQKTDVASEQFGARAKVLRELVLHHAEEEEEEMFPRAKKILGKARLLELGAAMETRKSELIVAAPGSIEKLPRMAAIPRNRASKPQGRDRRATP